MAPNARTGNAAKHFRRRIRQNLDSLVRAPKSGDFGYSQNDGFPGKIEFCTSELCPARLCGDGKYLKLWHRFVEKQGVENV
jgi:hypothetical protein